MALSQETQALLDQAFADKDASEQAAAEFEQAKTALQQSQAAVVAAEQKANDAQVKATESARAAVAAVAVELGLPAPV
jgi:hypothetical protein